MRVSIDETLTLEFDPFLMTKAQASIDKIVQAHPETAEDVLRAVATLLIFRQLEQQAPGTIERLRDSLGDACKSNETK